MLVVFSNFTILCAILNLKIIDYVLFIPQKIANAVESPLKGSSGQYMNDSFRAAKESQPKNFRIRTNNNSSSSKEYESSALMRARDKTFTQEDISGGAALVQSNVVGN